MVQARKYVVKKRFQGEPKRTDFEIVEEELAALGEGDMLVKAEWVSVDPYMRAYHNSREVPYDQFGFQVAVVVESRDPEFPVGCRVVSHKGWRDYSILSNKDGVDFFEKYNKIPDLPSAGLSESLAIGAIGHTGATAYFGLLELCQPAAGETVVVTGAAGAVGSLVGQIAKLRGCRVVGFAGSDDKVRWLQQELGFDAAINYKTADAADALRRAAPRGVDCYFDNVGGELSSAVLAQMNARGRVAVCGAISAYNDDPAALPKAAIVQPALVFKQIKMEGFLVHRWTDWGKAFVDLVKWIKSGEIKVGEHKTEGFEKIYDAFVGMLRGDNSGKAVVKV